MLTVTMSLLSILPALIYNDDRIVISITSPMELLKGGGLVGDKSGRVAPVNHMHKAGSESNIPVVYPRRDPETSDVSSVGLPIFLNNITNNLARGANLMTSISGCHIASWVYMVGSERLNRDCKGWRTDPQVRINLKEGPFPNIQPYDTIYVHSSMLTDFVDTFMPRLKVPIVLLSGSYDNTRANLMHRTKVRSLLDHPLMEHWFCQNIINTTGLLGYPLPAKLDPLALGVEPFDKNPRGPNPVVLLRDTILRYAHGLPNKSIPVFEAYTSPFTNPNRLNVPRGTKLTLPDYLEQLAMSKFVLSPSGHKPDCFRHYEALALGAIPVTDLDAATYSHLALGPVVFSTKDWWNLTEAELLRRMNLTVMPQANRNLIFEEFWMEEMERRVGRPLRWFDIRSMKRALLKDMYMNYDEIQTIFDSAWTDYSNDSGTMMTKFAGERNAWKVKGWPMPYL